MMTLQRAFTENVQKAFTELYTKNIPPGNINQSSAFNFISFIDIDTRDSKINMYKSLLSPI